MTEVKFGREYCTNPTGGFEHYGTSDKIITGNFIDFINIDGNTYLLTKVTEAFPSAELNEGDTYVIEAIAETYDNGYAILFLNSGNKDFCRSLERLLNNQNVDNIIDNQLKEMIDDICNSEAFEQISSRDKIITTEITESIFENKKETIKNKEQNQIQKQLKRI